MSKIEIRQLSKAFGSVAVLNGFSLEVAVGERIAVLGPSGCGKTTLLRLIAGLEMPDAGEIALDGKLVSVPGWVLPPHLRNVGVVFQSPALWPHMTVMGNILFGLSRLNKSVARRRAGDLLTALALDGLAERYPHQISGGEARRVALARALAPHPALLLLDEPLTNLNPELKEMALAVLEDHLERYKPTLVYVTHDHAEAHRISQRIVTLDGRRPG